MGLVIAPDLWGLRPLFDDHVERLSPRSGRWRCAPSSRSPASTSRRRSSRGAPLVAGLDDDAHLADLEAAADATGADRVGADRLLHGRDVHAEGGSLRSLRPLVAFYGMIRVPEDWRSPSQGEPLDHLATATRSACWRSSASMTPTRRPRRRRARGRRCHGRPLSRRRARLRPRSRPPRPPRGRCRRRVRPGAGVADVASRR